MNCPNCLAVMVCMSAINPVPGQPGKDRMDLHCSRNCGARCHMGVLKEDPKEWVCHDYNFEFREQFHTYFLTGYDYLVDPFHQHRPYGRKTILSTKFTEIMSVDFIPLSTGDNMHETAWNLFNRLKNMIIFS